MNQIKIILFTLLSSTIANAQEALKSEVLPYKEIGEYPETFNNENMLARMIDGLGFRFYWATEGLRAEDLSYKPTPDARSSEETIDHILGLTRMITNCVNIKPNGNNSPNPTTFDEKRKLILESLYASSQRLKSGTVKVEDLKIIFNANNPGSHLPVWNLINGPIADAIWHTGQVVSLRRASDNPFNSKVNLMTGKLRGS
jgi:hypothetical protein